MDERIVLEGYIAIEAALRADSRPVHAIWIQEDKRNRQTANLARMARAVDIPVRAVSAQQIAQQTEGPSHGGLVALAGERRFVSMDDLTQRSDSPFVVMLDGIEDPFNFGYAVRALYAAGADGLIVRPRNWMAATGTVARASAGASEWMPTAVADTVEDAAAAMRRRGLRVAAAARHNAASLYDANLAAPLFLLIGGERRGITRSFLERADLRIQIPYGRTYRASLGAAAATAVFAFEIMRQRAIATEGRRQS